MRALADFALPYTHRQHVIFDDHLHTRTAASVCNCVCLFVRTTCVCVCQVVGSTGRCLLSRWQMQLVCATAVCVCVCVLGGGLHLDTAGVCGGTVANGDLFPCQTFKV